MSNSNTKSEKASSAGFTSAELAEMDMVIARYPKARSAIMPLLHYVQSIDGYITDRGIETIAEKLNITEAEVTAVSTFYTQYKPEPVGEYHIGICTNTLCAIMGGDAIHDSVANYLGIECDGVTEDGKISLESIECNAACDYAPVVMVNWEFFDNQTPKSTRELIDQIKSGNPPAPTRGPKKLPTWKENSRTLAGFSDGLAHQGVQAGEPSLRGLKVSKEK
jgi:NADH-quinone oxidoreductase subunit E